MNREARGDESLHLRTAVFLLVGEHEVGLQSLDRIDVESFRPAYRRNLLDRAGGFDTIVGSADQPFDADEIGYRNRLTGNE